MIPISILWRSMLKPWRNYSLHLLLLLSFNCPMFLTSLLIVVLSSLNVNGDLCIQSPVVWPFFLLNDDMRTVPRGAHRNSFRESKWVVTADLYCDISSSEIKTCIVNSFSHLKLTSFYYMKCVGNSLITDEVYSSMRLKFKTNLAYLLVKKKDF